MKPPPIPPSLAGALVRFFSDPEDRAFLLEDLAERFHQVAETEGLRAANRWYWSQALSVVPWALRRTWAHPGGEGLRLRSWAGILGDLRSGLRTLWRSPLYAVGVSGTLGLGLAAATITFAVAWQVWWAPMPYPDPERVVRLYELEPLGPASRARQVATESRRHQLSAGLLEDLRAHSWRTIGAVSAVLHGVSGWTRDGDTERVSGIALSPNDGFAILGIVPVLGRLPTEGREVLITERFWRTTFGGDPDVVGSEMILNGRARRIVGVARLPSGYPGTADDVSVWEWSGGAVEEDKRGLRYLDAIARVKPGYSVAEAEAELNAFIAALGEIYPVHRGWGIEAVVLADDLLRPFRGVIMLLLAAGAIFLVLAAVNVVGLVAARRIEGRQDRSIRLALGASEGRLLRGSLIEGCVLAMIGSLAGLLGAYWLIGPIRGLVPQDVPRLDDVAVTPSLILGGLTVGLLVGMLIGLSGYLVSRGARPPVGRARVWHGARVGGRRALVIGQVALTTLLIAGGAAILHRVSTLRAIDLGFEVKGVSMTSTVLTPDGYSSLESRWNLIRALIDGFEGRGIGAAIATNPPMSGNELPPIAITADDASEEIFYQFHAITPAYFSVMGIELLAGRGFGPLDQAASTPVAVVSQEFVDQYFAPGTPIEDALGRVIEPIPLGSESRTVVAVVEPTRHEGPDALVMPDLYVPLSRGNFVGGTLLLRGEPDEIGEAVATVLVQADPDLPWSPIVPYRWHLREWFAPLRLQIIMIGVLGALGLLLASLGLYSLMAYQVASRRHELGIRKAVGAPDGRLMRGVLGSGMGLAMLGALVGLGAWYQLLPWTRQLVEGVDSAASLVPLSVALVVGGSCVVATFLPAMRAMRVDPVVTLKAE